MRLRLALQLSLLGAASALAHAPWAKMTRNSVGSGRNDFHPKRCRLPLLAQDANTDHSHARRRDANDVRQLWDLTVQDLPLISCAFGSLALASVGEVLMPQIQSSALNLAIQSGAAWDRSARAKLMNCLFKLASIGGATAVVTGLRGFLFWLCGARLVVRLRQRLYESMLAKPQSFHDIRAPSELGSRLSSDCIKLGDVLTLNVNIVLRQLLQTVGGLYFVWKIHRGIALLLFGGVCARSILSAVYGSLSRSVASAQQNALADASSVALQGLNLVQTVKAYGAQAFESTRYGSRLRALARLQTRQGVLYGSSRACSGTLNTFLLCMVFAVGNALVLRGTIPVESLTSLILYTEFVSSASGDIGDQWARVQEALGAATDVFRLLDPETSTAESKKPLVDVVNCPDDDDLSLQSVTFRYPSRDTTVLNRVNINARKGEVLALVGGSGSGKSTALKIALRFYAPDEGRVYLGGRDLALLTDEEFHSLVAWVPQEPALFPVSIRANIAYGLCSDSPLSDQCKIEHAARKANCHDFIMNLPHGYETILGTNGASLSGGQRQRIAIARAILREPKVLLLDEATSALDPESGRLVQDALHAASSDCAVVLTTHKLDQAALSDRIVVMLDGNVVEEGAHADLVSKGGYYWSLLQQRDLEECTIS